MSTSLHELTELLRELPGIGPRQARRLALWLAQRDVGWVERLGKTLIEVRRSVHTCASCMRLFEPGVRKGDACSICTNTSRERSMLLVVEKDVDVENIERTGTYRGLYFVLGGNTNALDKDPEQKIRIIELEHRLRNTKEPVTEAILALSATTEGEDTATYIIERITALLKKQSITLSILGRGLSTGTELEYVDADTMKSALSGRHSA